MNRICLTEEQARVFDATAFDEMNADRFGGSLTRFECGGAITIKMSEALSESDVEDAEKLIGLLCNTSPM